jgi:hypothetical protein
MLPRSPLDFAALAQCSAKDLHVLWLQWFDTRPPAHMRQSLLVRALAYRMQEREYGGLSGATRTHLHALANVRRPEPIPNGPKAPQVLPGTHVIREWGNEMHQVTVEMAGYLYRGQRYRSLSEIARKITGTRWSGPAFFGVQRHRPDHPQHERS